MKVGILTHPLKSNYGGILQNYALQIVLKMLNHQPETINYYVNYPIYRRILSIGYRLFQKVIHRDIIVNSNPTRKQERVISQNTNKFIYKHIVVTPLIEFSKISQLDGIYDAIIVGSDQVWRGDRAGDIRKFFLSDFNKTVIKLSYAASMGVDWWTYDDIETKECAYLLRKFAGVSVREKATQDMCEKYFGIKPELLIDPTMLIDKEDYMKIISSKPRLYEENNVVFSYILDKTSEKEKLIEVLVNTVHGVPKQVMPKAYFSQVGSKGINECVYPSVEDWLRSFDEAKYVITDSFHGTVFSIIFNKPFVTILNKQRGNSRFYSLLSKFNLKDRIVDSADSVKNVILQPIDYNSVNKILYSEKEKGYDFLKKHLNL